jgi:uncharacterized repeat protein (TIGR03803 family)
MEALEPRLVLTGPGNYTLTQLASFPVGPGFQVVNGPALDGKGNLWAAITTGGLTSQGPNGGQVPDGSIVEELKGTSQLITVAQFNGANGVEPYGGVIFDKQGNLFGVTERGGSKDDGTIWELPVGGNAINLLASFMDSPGSEGLNPLGGLVIDGQGNLYGTTSAGGQLVTGQEGAGTVYEFTPGNPTITTLYTFDGTHSSAPHNGLLLDGTELVGATSGGQFNRGTVFEVSTSGGQYQTIADFTLSDATLGFPVSNLIMDMGGNFFGEASNGVYEVPVGGNVIQSLGTFANANSQYDAQTAVLLDGAGDLFGTTFGGGTFGPGTAFEVVQGSNTISTIANFGTPDSHGNPTSANPNSPLVSDGHGNFFGMTANGGDSGFGFFYELSPAATQLAFGPLPSDPIANQAFVPPLTVHVQDAAGNDVTTDTSIVTLVVSNGPTGGSIVGAASAPDVKGVATFAGVSVNLPGTYVFGAVDGTLTPAQTAPILVGALPTSTILFPTAGSYSPGTWTGSIAGTARASVGTLATVGVAIFDGTNYWNGADARFDSANPVFNDATLTQANWSYAFPTTNLTTGKSYSVQSQAKDSLGNLQTLGAGVSFTFSIPIATVSSLSPTFGSGGALQDPAAAGTVVTITGTNLDNATGVSFGGLPAQFTIDSPTELKAIAPRGGAGLVDIVVANGGGNSAKSAADQFSFVSTAIASGQQGAFVSTGPTLTPLASLPALPAGVSAEFADAIGFTVAGVGIGGKVTVVIQLPVGTLQAGTTYAYEKFSPKTNTWSAFVTDNGDSVNFDVADQQIQLTLTDGGSDDEDGATDQNITDPGLPVANAGSPTQLGFGPLPTNSVANQPFTPPITVKVEDSAGNVVTTDTSAVTLTVTSGPSGGVLSGSTQQAAMSGIATFSGLFATVAGTYVVNATDGRLSTGISIPFFVGAKPASAVAFPSASSYLPSTWTAALTGTDSVGAGATVTSVGVNIFDGTHYWNPADSAFDSATALFNAAALGQGTWSYPFPTANLTNGKTYTVRSQATDSLGEVETPSVGATFSFSIPAPTVTAVSPVFGTGGSPQAVGNQGAGGTQVTITGTNLDGAQEVLFGTLPAQFHTVSSTEIQAVAPQAGLGTVDIVVGTGGGVSAKSSADRFTFVTATLTGGPSEATLSSGPTLTPLASLPSLPAGVTPLAAAVVGFMVTNVGKGGTVTVEVQLPKGSLQAAVSTGVSLAYYKFNATTHSWSAFVSDGGDKVQFDIAADQVDLTLTDGGLDDQDGSANGVIVDPGLPVLAPSGTAPSITSANHVTFIVGATSEFVLTASGSPAPTLGETGALPGGLEFDASTGKLSGTPSANSAGAYSITFTVSNGVASPASQSFQLTVLSANQAYIAAVFRDVLRRQVDSDGLQFFTGLLDHGTARSAVVGLVNHSAEYFGQIIQAAYSVYLGRSAEQAAVKFWSKQLIGAITDVQFAASVLGTPEAFAHAGGTTKHLIDALYQQLLGRPAEPAGESFWLGQFASGSRADAIAFSFATSNEFNTNLIDQDFMYLLDRATTKDEMASLLPMLDQGVTHEDLFAQIAATAEYADRLALRTDL